MLDVLSEDEMDIRKEARGKDRRRKGTTKNVSDFFFDHFHTSLARINDFLFLVSSSLFVLFSLINM